MNFWEKFWRPFKNSQFYLLKNKKLDKGRFFLFDLEFGEFNFKQHVVNLTQKVEQFVSLVPRDSISFNDNVKMCLQHSKIWGPEELLGSHIIAFATKQALWFSSIYLLTPTVDCCKLRKKITAVYSTKQFVFIQTKTNSSWDSKAVVFCAPSCNVNSEANIFRCWDKNCSSASEGFLRTPLLRGPPNSILFPRKNLGPLAHKCSSLHFALIIIKILSIFNCSKGVFSKKLRYKEHSRICRGTPVSVLYDIHLSHSHSMLPLGKLFLFEVSSQKIRQIQLVSYYHFRHIL